MGIRTRLSSMGYNNIGDSWDGKSFKFSATPIRTGINLYTLRITTPNTLEPYINPITVDWGDGIIEVFSQGSFSHEYDMVKSYNITITSETGKMPLLRLETSNGIFENIYTPLMECYNGQNLETNFDNVFSGVQGVIPSNIFIMNNQITSLNYAFGYTQNIPSGILSNLNNLTSLESCFNSLESIPNNLLNSCANVTNFSGCFSSNYLTNIPNGLFDNCSSASDLSYCFSSTYKIKNVPLDIFANNKNITNLNSCFKSSGAEELPELWNVFTDNVIVHTNCFDGCDNAKNYSKCPYDWGGPTSIRLNVTPEGFDSEFTTGDSRYDIFSSSNDYAYTNHWGHIKYKVIKDGYSTYFGEAVEEQKIENIELKPRNIPFAINVIPLDANIDVTLYGETTTATGTFNTMVASGDTITYKVYKDGLNTQENTIEVNSNTTLNIELKNIDTLYNLEYPFTDTELDINTNLLSNGFIIDSSRQSICTADTFGIKKGYILIPPINNKNNINLLIDAEYANYAYQYYCIYVGTKQYSPSYNDVGDLVTDGYGQYILAYYSSNTSMPSTKRVNTSIPIKANTQYYINVGGNGYRKDGVLDIYSIKITADQDDN